jgi:hypothetical protein
MKKKQLRKIKLLEAEITQVEINLQDLLEHKVHAAEVKGFPQLKKILRKAKKTT